MAYRSPKQNPGEKHIRQYTYHIIINYLPFTFLLFSYSVASPFTSRISDITCVPKVIREGRAALVTSFGIFKFMVAYSLTEFLSVIVLYSIDSNLTDLQFLFIDICLIVNFAFFFGKTHAHKRKLSKKTPMTSLLSFTPLLSLTANMFVFTLFQATAYHTVRQFPWFTPFVRTNTDEYTCYENYSVFCVSMFQYITMAIIFSRGKPYRRAIYTNGVFMFSILTLTIICTYITIYPANWIVKALQLILPPYEWRFIILALALANFLICFFIESFIIEHMIENTLRRKLYKPEKSKKRYLKIEYELKHCTNWPTLSKQLSVLSILQEKNSIPNTDDHCRSVSSDQMANDFNNSIKPLGGKISTGNGIENLSFVNDQM